SMTPTFVEPVVQWAQLVPIIVVLGAGVLGVLVEAFVPQQARRATQLVLTFGALIGALAALVVQWRDHAQLDYVTLVDGALLVTSATLFIQATVVILAILALVVVADRSTGTDAFAPAVAAVPGSDYEELARRKGLVQTEIYPLFLFAVGGMLIFPAAGNLLTMFVALEVLSLPLYVMCGMARHRRLLSQEASAKYFLLGAFASALFLFGMALVYGYAASLDFETLNRVVAAGGLRAGEDLSLLLVVGVVLMLAGALFKVGAVPFHQWTPDVYQGAPTPITGFMAACTKAAAFGAVLRLLYLVVAAAPAEMQEHIRVALWVVAIATMVLGSVVAVVQQDIKRVLAYSSIAHAGFILVAIVTPSYPGISAVLFYLLAYGLATIGAFAIVHLVRETSGPDGEVVLGEATHLTQWAGLGKRRPWLAGAFTLFLLSFAGIPLTAGFIGKFLSFSAAVNTGNWVLALIGVLCSAIAVFFYVRIVVLMYFVDPAGTARAVSEESGRSVPDAASSVGSEAGVGLRVAAAPARTDVGVRVLRGGVAIRTVIAVCAIATLVLGVLPGPVLNLVTQAAKFLP
ncbi:MAG: NADH-quinone oxidoreductase subunit NuoN, partial [Cellulomonadaceae bacterium]